MFQTLMNNSLLIIAGLTLLAMAVNHIRIYLKREDKSLEQFKLEVAYFSKEVLLEVMPKVYTSIVVSALIYGLTYNADSYFQAFRIVLLTMVLVPLVHKYLFKVLGK